MKFVDSENQIYISGTDSGFRSCDGFGYRPTSSPVFLLLFPFSPVFLLLAAFFFQTSGYDAHASQFDATQIGSADRRLCRLRARDHALDSLS
jgi:hypothetical protein